MAANDALKRWVARTVKEDAVKRFAGSLGPKGEDIGVREVTVHEVSELVTSVRVKTATEGTRYFEVRVKECW